MGLCMFQNVGIYNENVDNISVFQVKLLFLIYNSESEEVLLEGGIPGVHFDDSETVRRGKKRQFGPKH